MSETRVGDNYRLRCLGHGFKLTQKSNQLFTAKVMNLGVLLPVVNFREYQFEFDYCSKRSIDYAITINKKEIPDDPQLLRSES